MNLYKNNKNNTSTIIYFTVTTDNGPVVEVTQPNNEFILGRYYVTAKFVHCASYSVHNTFCCLLHKEVLSDILSFVVTRCMFVSFYPRHQLNNKPVLKIASVFRIIDTLMHYWQELLKVMGITGRNQEVLDKEFPNTRAK